MKFWLLLLLLSCRRPEPVVQPPTVTTSSTSPWQVAKLGRTASLSGPEGLFVFVDGGPADLDAGLAGISLGDQRGPNHGLLGGYFAPLLIPEHPTERYELRITANNHLTVSGPNLDARIWREGPHVKLAARGRGAFLIPNDHTQLRAWYQGAPSFGATFEGRETPAYLTPRGERLELQTRRHGTWLFESGCPRLFVVRPLPRGSTSTFLILFGGPADPLYAPDAPAPPNECTATSTLSVPWPPS